MTAPTAHPTTKDIAWAAGVYEGEGCVNTNRNGGIRISVGQKDRWLLDKMRDLFGGRVFLCTSRAGRLGGVIHRWDLYGSRAHGLAMTIFGFLSPRRRGQVRSALIKGRRFV